MILWNPVPNVHESMWNPSISLGRGVSPREQIIAGKILQRSQKIQKKIPTEVMLIQRGRSGIPNLPVLPRKSRNHQPASPGMKDVVVVAGIADGSPGSHGIVTRNEICHWDCPCSCSWEKLQVFLSRRLEISLIPLDYGFDNSNCSWSRD